MLWLPLCCYAQEKTLTVLLDWFPNPNHAPLFVAVQQGFFKAHGLEVKLISPGDPTDPPKLIAAGKADIAITYEPQFLQQVDSGLPLILIGTLINRPLACVLTLKSDEIKTLADLKGKRIGTSIEATTDVIFKTMLEKSGLSLADVEILNIHYSLTQALLSHNIAAATGMMRNYELPQLMMSGHPVNAFYPEDYGVPTYSELILVAHRNIKHDPRIQPFLSALTEAVQYLKTHPEQTWRDFIKQYPENNNAFSKQAWLITIPYFNNQPAQFNAQEWQQFAAYLLRNGLIHTIPQLNRYTLLERSGTQ